MLDVVDARLGKRRGPSQRAYSWLVLSYSLGYLCSYTWPEALYRKNPVRPRSRRFVAKTNLNPKLFVWTADPKRVLAAVKRGKQTLKSVH